MYNIPVVSPLVCQWVLLLKDASTCWTTVRLSLFLLRIKDKLTRYWRYMHIYINHFCRRHVHTLILHCSYWISYISSYYKWELLLTPDMHLLLVKLYVAWYIHVLAFWHCKLATLHKCYLQHSQGHKHNLTTHLKYNILLWVLPDSLQIRDDLPHLKAVVQYHGKLAQKCDGLYEVKIYASACTSLFHM